MIVPGWTPVVVRLLFVLHLAQIIVSSPLSPVGKGAVINDFIRHFEPAVYDRDALASQHRRLRRDTSAPPLQFRLHAHNRVFNMRLVPDREVFADDVIFEGTNGPVHFNPNKAYVGSLEDDELSTVHGIITEDGLFDGSISTQSDDFYVEPVTRYLGNSSVPPPSYHSIVYRRSDVVIPRQRRHCASRVLRSDGPISLARASSHIHQTPPSRTTRYLLEHIKSPSNERSSNPAVESTRFTDKQSGNTDWTTTRSVNTLYPEQSINLPEYRKPAYSLQDDPREEITISEHSSSKTSSDVVPNPSYDDSTQLPNRKDSKDHLTPYVERSKLPCDSYWDTNVQKPSLEDINLPEHSNRRSSVDVKHSRKLPGYLPRRSIGPSSTSEKIVNHPESSNFDFHRTFSEDTIAQSSYKDTLYDIPNPFTEHKRTEDSSYKDTFYTQKDVPLERLTEYSNEDVFQQELPPPGFDSYREDVDNINPYYYNPNIIFHPNPYNVTRDAKILNEPSDPYDSNAGVLEDLLYPKRTKYMDDSANSKHVNKRATVDPKKTTCMLYLQADHLFFQKYGTEEACIEVMTRHVQRVNSIYKTTDFNQDGKSDNISFMIKRIKVHSLDALKDPNYRFPLNYGVEKFLELFSEEDYDAFCLAYMFTYRDFEMGTLGLAWTGDLKNAGGVCEKNGHYRGSMKSLNTGIVTLLNYGKHVPPAVSHVTLAHEIGHNFGSPHDPELCTPGGEDGNFIMFARATSGDKRNNNKFSPCSLNSINPVLNVKARSGKGCFTEPQVSLCGNGVVEEGEECDCGWEGDCKDHCCFPQRRYPPPDEPPCRLTPRSICSPSQGPCCTPECHLKFGDKCRDDNGCRDSSYCDGRGPHCPPSVNKPNKTICNEEFVCFMGECTGSICLAYGLESCQCIPGPHDSKTKACELCCKLPGDGHPCLSSFEWNAIPYDVPDMFSKPGTPCNDYNGYCDVFQKCREVDPSGPLATLRKLLLSEESIASFKRWVSDHWYAVLLIAAAVLFVMVISTRVLGKRPNPKLKSITIIHSSTTETVRLPPDGENGQVTVHPAAVRSKLPLQRKVREARLRRQQRKSKDPATPSKKHVSGKKPKKKKLPPQPPPPKASPEEPANKKQEEEVKRKPKKVPVKKKKAKKKEVIDYSSAQGEKDKPGLDTDPVCKVKNWLLNSQHPETMHIRKSKSTPAGLTSGGHGKSRRARNEPPVSHSTGNLQGSAACKLGDKDKVRLQVIYKPPFKFSVKLRKAEKGGGVVVVDKARGGPPNPRTAMLLRTRGERRKRRVRDNEVKLPVVVPAVVKVPREGEDIDSNIHTVPSDLEVLLSESEFLFSDA